MYGPLFEWLASPVADGLLNIEFRHAPIEEFLPQVGFTFLESLLLPLVVLFFVLPIRYSIGTSFGIPQLFFHEIWWKRLGVGIGLSFVAAQVTFLAVLLTYEQIEHRMIYYWVEPYLFLWSYLLLVGLTVLLFWGLPYLLRLVFKPLRDFAGFQLGLMASPQWRPESPRLIDRVALPLGLSIGGIIILLITLLSGHFIQIFFNEEAKRTKLHELNGPGAPYKHLLYIDGDDRRVTAEQTERLRLLHRLQRELNNPDFDKRLHSISDALTSLNRLSDGLPPGLLGVPPQQQWVEYLLEDPKIKLQLEWLLQRYRQEQEEMLPKEALESDLLLYLKFVLGESPDGAWLGLQAGSLLSWTIFTCMILGFLIFYPPRPPQYGLFSPAFNLCLVTIALLAIYGSLSFLLDFTVTGALVVFLVALSLGGIPLHKYRLFAVTSNGEAAGRQLNRQTSPVFNYRQSPLRSLAAPMAQSRGLTPRRLEDEELSIFVCAAGGGIKAAAWTVAVLRHLHAICEELPCRIHLVSGASGGMVGAAYWTSMLTDGNVGENGFVGDFDIERARSDEQFAAISADVLSPVVLRLIFPDIFLSLFSPFHLRKDRGVVLEQAWSHSLSGALDRSLEELAEAEAKRLLPSLVFSPMLVEDGRRLLISNLDLGFLCNASSGAEALSTSAIEFSRLFPEIALNLATAARMSATFPYISPNVSLPVQPSRRIADAGFFDNYGVHFTSRYLLNHVPPKFKGRILLIRIEAGTFDGTDTSLPAESEVPPLFRALAGVTGPVQALLSASDSIMRYRNDEQVALLSSQLGERFLPLRFQCSNDVPLSWYLTERDKQNILESLRATVNINATSRFREWCTDSTSSSPRTTISSTQMPRN